MKAQPARPQRLQLVRSASIRVALVAAALVAVVYLLIAVAVVLIVTRNLTGQIDDHLAGSLAQAIAHPFPAEGGINEPEPDPNRRFGPVLLFWTVRSDGTVVASQSDAQLPAEDEQATAPQTITIGGEQIRIRGADVTGGGHLVVGQTLESVSEAANTLVRAELIIGPILLITVFAGAVAIGRRVAAPIEEARQRQLEFTADASHELRTPLSVIEAHTSLALAQERDLAWYRSAFTQVDAESKRMRHLVDDLLWLARFDATRGQPNAEPVDLGVLATQTVERFRIIAEARGIDLATRGEGEGQMISAPPEWLDRLLGVLLDNACRYSPGGGNVTVTVSDARGRVRLAVDDSGPGIAPEERPRIFDRFHRATQTPGGAGLGLAIADAVVRATNGRWTIGTSPAGGASMSVSWPRAFSGPREAAATHRSTAGSSPSADSRQA
jgi:two-component system sensor histidine kinase CiaH